MSDDRDELWRVPLDGGSPEGLGFSTENVIDEIAVQPNGESIAFVMNDGERPGVRVIEKLLPAGGAVRP
jgi:tricorn protease-like protein